LIIGGMFETIHAISQRLKLLRLFWLHNHCIKSCL